jgi:hypothetical protein
MNHYAFCQHTVVQNAFLSADKLNIDFADGRSLSVPLKWYPRLLYANLRERCNWRLSAGGRVLEWPELGERIGIEGLLQGQRSNESVLALQQWLNCRTHIAA